MALTQSVDKVDESGREVLTYGTEYFPIAFFDDDLTKVAVPPHWHDELELIIIIKGKVHVRIAGSEFLLSAGEGYFANSGILHAADSILRDFDVPKWNPAMYEQTLKHLIEETKAGRMFGEWNDYGRLLEED